MKIGVLQLNSTIGDYPANRRKLVAGYERAVAAGAELVLAPELFLSGSTPHDLLLQRDFIEAGLTALSETAQVIGPVPLCVGCVTSRASGVGTTLANAAVILQHGKIIGQQNKTILSERGALNEKRYFHPAQQSPYPFVFNGRKIGIIIGGDVNQEDGEANEPPPVPNRIHELVAQGVEVILNLAAFPWHVEEERKRFERLQRVARNNQVPVVQANLVGGNDGSIFDGRSMAFNRAGELIACGKAFAEDVLLVELDEAQPINVNWPAREEQLFHALALGVRDYVHKCGFKSAIIGLSGGIDSALVAVVAVAALGADQVMGVSLPACHSSSGSLTDAKALAKNLGIRYEVVSIKPGVAAVEEQLEQWFAGTQPNEAEENIQARLRGVTLMALANKFGAMVLNTGNKSESAVGYCTLYGDTCGALAVLTDVYKTEVYAISRWINRDREIIPAATIAKAPSAELRPNQKDQDSLPPYEVLDALLRSYVEENLSVKEIIARGFSPALVEEIIRKVAQSEYKRRQAPPGLLVSSRPFGSGRGVPIAQRFRSPV